MQTFQSFDTTSIISSTKSTNSKRQNAPGDAQSTISLGIKNPSTLSYSNYPLNNHANHFAHPGPLKNTLSIRLAESAVFLRTNDLTGRNRYGDSRPTYLRGVVQLELVKPTRISRIVLELGAKVGTIWPEGESMYLFVMFPLCWKLYWPILIELYISRLFSSCNARFGGIT
ncbi:hypothetical protein C8R41DRAFT_235959 [Lentinula lateritia]|uniref:Uncharacterized protein n=1 Tax=Lentinula lateritia TaxID=40482 RepID=A0ABQ8VP80_9AGAR|nr:hypothetical protein C8R41DRAFT_235959 [Lentinula lateritia]